MDCGVLTQYFQLSRYWRLMRPLSPKNYREQHEGELNEWRVAAGLPTKTIYEEDDAIIALQTAAGIR